MHIILEGPDNSGKSTLAQELSRQLNRPIVSSEGPEKYPGEVNERIERYSQIKVPVIFDRHPVISQPIYSMIKQNTLPDEQLSKNFYNQPLVIIYCRANPNRGMNEHLIKAHDTPEFVEKVTTQYKELVHAYDTWALEKAHLIYRIGDDVNNLISRIADFDPVRDIVDFHNRFKLHYTGKPRVLPQEMARFRQQFLNEEYQEYLKSHKESVDNILHPSLPGFEDSLVKSLADSLDALVDLVYVAIGTADLHGFNFRQAWYEVHKANMSKVRAESKDQSKRGSTFDVVKPEGWVPPDHVKLVKDHAHK